MPQAPIPLRDLQTVKTAAGQEEKIQVLLQPTAEAHRLLSQEDRPAMMLTHVDQASPEVRPTAQVQNPIARLRE